MKITAKYNAETTLIDLEIDYQDDSLQYSKGYIRPTELAVALGHNARDAKEMELGAIKPKKKDSDGDYDLSDLTETEAQAIVNYVASCRRQLAKANPANRRKAWVETHNKAAAFATT